MTQFWNLCMKLLNFTKFGYTGFSNYISVYYGVKSHLELNQDIADLEEVLPVISPEPANSWLYVPAFYAFRKVRLNKKYKITRRETITNIVTTFVLYFWLGLRVWFRMTVVPGCR